MAKLNAPDLQPVRGKSTPRYHPDGVINVGNKQRMLSTLTDIEDAAICQSATFCAAAISRALPSPPDALPARRARRSG